MVRTLISMIPFLPSGWTADRGVGAPYGPWKTTHLLLMAEILHQLRLVVYPIIYRVLYISGGAGFLPSTVVWRGKLQNSAGGPQKRTNHWVLENPQWYVHLCTVDHYWWRYLGPKYNLYTRLEWPIILDSLDKSHMCNIKYVHVSFWLLQPA